MKMLLNFSGKLGFWENTQWKTEKIPFDKPVKYILEEKCFVGKF